MTQDPNLPDGCKQADIDRAMGAMPEELEKLLDEQGAKYDEAREILDNLRSIAEEQIASFRRVENAYTRASCYLQDMLASLNPTLRNEIETVKETIENFEIPSPPTAVNEALECLMTWPDISEEIAEKWREENGW